MSTDRPPRPLRLPIDLSWWACSLPLAAGAVALYVLLVATVAGLAWRTAVAVRRRTICPPHI